MRIMKPSENDKELTKQAESLTEEAPVTPQSNVESIPPSDEPITSIENKDSEGMSLKDRSSLAISCLALLLSIAGFTYQILNNRNQEARARNQEARSQNQEARIQKQEDAAQKQIAEAQRRARTHAYNLGKQFTAAYVVFLHTNKGNPKDIADAKDSAKRFLDQNTRELAVALGLSPDLTIYLVDKKSLDVFGSYGGPLRSLEKKLASFNTEETVAAFNVGSSLWYLVLVKEFAKVTGKEEHFRSEVFPVFRDSLNRNMKILGVDDDSMLPEFDNMEEVSRRLGDMKKKYDVEFGGSK